MASLIQFVGTLWFNRTTFSALVVGLGAATNSHHPIWRPDALGSVCFLVASWLAWAEECNGAFAWRPDRLSWWITLLNLVGSIAFGVSAVASYVKPNGDLVSLALTNLGTFVGAVCFLVGAILLLPERMISAPWTCLPTRLAFRPAAQRDGIRAEGRDQLRDAPMSMRSGGRGSPSKSTEGAREEHCRRILRRSPETSPFDPS